LQTKPHPLPLFDRVHLLHLPYPQLLPTSAITDSFTTLLIYVTNITSAYLIAAKTCPEQSQRGLAGALS
jgi:hypothetical protein